MNKLNLENEVICNYEVTSEMKKVWQIELDILEKIIKICDENNIKYCLSGGSLLGAIRHKGFIPWDDDIDIAMKREDYNNFLKIASKEIKAPLFLQYYESEKGYFYGHTQIRNSETTAVIDGDQYRPFNKGIFVDIFPLDNVPDNKLERKLFLFNLKLHKKLFGLYYYQDSKNLCKRIIKRIIIKTYWKIFDYQKQINKFEQLVCKYNKFETKECGMISFLPNMFKYENEWLKENIKTDFEYLKVSVPKMYDICLKAQYGNYMEIPEIKNGSMHGKVFFDTEKSYKEYENDIENIVKEYIKGE